jgi:preprotein translocase subunit SecA
MSDIERDSLRFFLRAELVQRPTPPPAAEPAEVQASHDRVGYLSGTASPPADATATRPEEAPGAPAGAGAPPPGGPRPVRRSEPKVSRNDPCPCGSGKKYKKCCGRV